MATQKSPFVRLYIFCFVLGLFAIPLYMTLTMTFGMPILDKGVAMIPGILSISGAILLPTLRYKGFARNHSWNVEVLVISLFLNLLGLYIAGEMISKIIFPWYIRQVPAWIDPEYRYLGPILAIPLLISVAWLDNGLRNGFDDSQAHTKP